MFAAFLYFDFTFAIWVLNGAMAPFISETYKLSPAQKGFMVSVPIIASGGYADAADVKTCAEHCVNALAVADALHYKRATVGHIKAQAAELGLEVR